MHFHELNFCLTFQLSLEHSFPVGKTKIKWIISYCGQLQKSPTIGESVIMKMALYYFFCPFYEKIFVKKSSAVWYFSAFSIHVLACLIYNGFSSCRALSIRLVLHGQLSIKVFCFDRLSLVCDYFFIPPPLQATVCKMFENPVAPAFLSQVHFSLTGSRSRWYEAHRRRQCVLCSTG